LKDVLIAQVLTDAGFLSEREQLLARATLEHAGLTRAGKVRMSDTKLDRSRGLLAEHFAFGCANCLPELRLRRPDAVVFAVRPERCRSCFGSSNRLAAVRFAEACREHRIRLVVVVGGSPSTRRALASELGRFDLELELIDGTGTMTKPRAGQLIGRADLVLVWGNTQLDHRVSESFTSSAVWKVVRAHKRGVAGVLEAGTLHLESSRDR
jgi:hypothetical protein